MSTATTTAPTPAEALAQLRRVVAAAPDDRLHMRRVTEEADCGTAHCALGWALVDPWFAQRLPVDPATYPEGPAAAARAWADGDYFDVPLRYVREFLGLSEADAEALFGASLTRGGDPHAVTKAEVLWNIDRLRAGLPALPYRATWRPVPVYAGDADHPDGYPNEDWEDD